MSEQSPRQIPLQPAATKLENQYKPVGIAAIRAAALCKSDTTKKQEKK